ncbi:hypothetical protein BS47DRAFT_1360992 [Hydnum rufescens UP504]|uniref:Uncharacterized protein n=1 Tax=Hydnum rufescens UP504 TaxID=1448309 RepID=A0A9P6B0I6_9AGAM|nr:hypothetical protein BS47DRAFT_1360992 [Hydnum rufescens UP504]
MVGVRKGRVPSTTHNTEGKTGSHPHYGGCGPIWLSPQLNDDPNNDVYETCDDHVDKMCVVLSGRPKSMQDLHVCAAPQTHAMINKTKYHIPAKVGVGSCKVIASHPNNNEPHPLQQVCGIPLCGNHRYNSTRRAAGAAFLVLPQITPTLDKTLPGKNVDELEHKTLTYAVLKTLPNGNHLPPDETPYNKNTDDTPPEIRMHAASPMKCHEIDHWNAHARKSHLGYMHAKPLQNVGT